MPIPLLPVGSSNAGHSVAEYRAVLAAALGWYSGSLTTDSVGSTNSLICSQLADSDLENTFLDGVWSLITSGPLAGQVRRCKSQSFAMGTGTVTMTRGYSTSVANSTTFELFGVLPPIDQLGRRGLLTCMNLALRECWIEDYLAITGDGSSYQYDLSTTYPWLQAEDQIIDVWIRRLSMTRDMLVAEWRFRADAEAPQLEFKVPVATNDTIKPYVHRPLDTWIQSSGVWGESTTGLVNDSDRALLNLNGMLTVGLYHCYASLATIGDMNERAQWEALASRQRIKANKWKLGALRRDVGRDNHWRQTWSTLAPAFPLEGSLGTSDGI